ncbi:MAG: AMP-binding protein [Lachnospiraceae bacterium]|nr:AMP-binding protein [Lachnospiraceae bacterium]
MFLNLDKIDSERIAAKDSHGCSLSYGRLTDFCDTFPSAYSLERGIAFVFCRNNIETLAVYVACMAKRIVPLMLSADIDEQLFLQLADIYHPAYLFGRPEDIKAEGERVKIAFPESSGEYCLVRTDYEPWPLNDSLALLLTTSGSTGSPKLVRHSYSNLERQAGNVAKLFELTEEDRPLLNLPLMYTMGLSIANSHLLKGCSILLTDESILSKPFATFIRSEGITSITGVPYTYELLKRVRLERLNLPALNLLSQGGGKLRAELQKEFASYIRERGGRYIATYGQTEGSARMAYLPPEYALDKIGSIGRAIPEGKLYLKDEKGTVITTPNTEGEMVYEGPNVTLGYAECGEDLARGDERNGVLPTGDLAYFDEDGMFYITGRLKRFLKLFGHRVGLDECEKIIRDELKIDNACVGNDSRLVVYVPEKEYRDDIKKVLADRTGLYAHGIEVRTIEELPRSEAGKIRYSALEI